MGKPGEYQSRLKKRFREAGAVGDGNEKTAAELGVTDAYSLKMLESLVWRGIVILKGDKYFLAGKYRESFFKRLFGRGK